jgi:hypothetical protein
LIDPAENEFDDEHHPSEDFATIAGSQLALSG